MLYSWPSPLAKLPKSMEFLAFYLGNHFQMVHMRKKSRLKEIQNNIAKILIGTSYFISFLSRQNNDPKDILFKATLLSRTTKLDEPKLKYLQALFQIHARFQCFPFLTVKINWGLSLCLILSLRSPFCLIPLLQSSIN